MTNPPIVLLPKGLEFYADPEIESSYRFSPMGSHGKIIYTYNILPKIHGEIELDSIAISFFNPKKEKYEVSSIKGPSYHIIQNKNYRAPENDSIDPSGAIAKLPPIKNEIMIFNDGDFYGSTTFWFLIGSPIFLSIAFLLFVFFKKTNVKNGNDQFYLNERKLKLNQYLQKVEVEKTNGTNQAFYEAIENSIRFQYEIILLGNDSKKVLLRAEVESYLETEGKLEELNIVQELFNISEQVRYAPMTVDLNRDEVIKKLNKIIQRDE